MVAMQLVNIPTYTTIRRTTTVFVLGLERILLPSSSQPPSSRHNCWINTAVALMGIGALIAGFNDLSLSPLSLLCLMMYNVVTALYLVLIARINAEEQKLPSSTDKSHARTPLSSWDFMLYNSLFTLPMALIISWWGDEWSKLGPSSSMSSFQESASNSSGYWSTFLASSALAFVLNYSVFLNTRLNSALTHAVVGQAKDIGTILLGFTLFADSRDSSSPLALVGHTVGFGAAFMYAWVKLQATKR